MGDIFISIGIFNEKSRFKAQNTTTRYVYYIGYFCKNLTVIHLLAKSARKTISAAFFVSKSKINFVLL
jgi:phage-related protein